jgi:ribosome biogenesis protein NSA1
MRLLTGDECGILKECLPSLLKNAAEVAKDEGIQIVNPHERPSRRRGIVDLSWSPRQSSPGYCFAALRMDGTVQVWRRKDSTKKNQLVKHQILSEVHGVFADGASEASGELGPATRPLGLAGIRGDGSSSGSCVFAACNAQGKVSVLNAGEDMNLSVVRRFSTLDTNLPATKTLDHYPLASCMGVHDAKAWVAVGGKDRETSIYDIETAERVWKTKNLPPDPQTLLQPITWPSAVLFLNDQHRMVVGNDLQVRLYDVRADSIQRRPIAFTPKGLLEQRVTCFCQTGDNALVVGDTTGCLMTVDVRNLKTATNQARFVGPAGSVRQLVKHGRAPRMAAVGLDRMLRVYDTKSRKQVTCMYLKQRLNCVLMDDTGDDDLADSSELGNEEENGSRSEDVDQDDVVDDYVDSDAESNIDSEEDLDDDSESGETGSSGKESSEDAAARKPCKRQRK